MLEDPFLVEKMSFPEAEAIRKRHAATEWNLRVVGFIYFFGWIWLMAFSISRFSTEGMDQMAESCAGILAGAVYLYAGPRLFRLRPWTRVFAIVSSVLVLPLFPLGTLFGICVLTDLIGKKAAMVFSPEYRNIIRQTPDVKRTASVSFWIIVMMAAAVLCFMVLGKEWLSAIHR